MKLLDSLQNTVPLENQSLTPTRIYESHVKTEIVE